MTAFPAAGHITNAARTEGEVKTDLDNWLAATKELPGGAAGNSLTISSGSITPTSAVMLVDTEGAASSDDLTNIAVTNMPDGRIISLKATASGRTVVVKHNAGGSGQITLADGVDLSLVDPEIYLVLRNAGGTTWKELFRSYGPRKDLARAFFGVSNTPNRQTGAYTIVATDQGKVIEATSGTWTLGATAVATLGESFSCKFKNTGSGTITFDPNSSETVDGASTYVFGPGMSAELVISNGQWIVVGKGLGTPASSTDNSVVLWSGTTGKIVKDGPSLGSSGQVLTSNGAGAAPSFQTVASVVASDSEVETATDTSKIVPPGRVHRHPGVAKFWCQHNSSGTISVSRNMTSVTHNGTGDWTATIAQDFSSGSWCFFGTCSDIGLGRNLAANPYNKTAGAVSYFTRDNSGTLRDPGEVYVGGFGDHP